MGKEVLLIILAVIFASLVFAGAQGGTEISSVLLKASVKDGGFTTKDLTITSSQSGNFELRAVSIDGIELSDESFFVEAGEVKKVEVVFDSAELEPGIYVGSIEINGPVDSSNVPVIFEVESRDVFFDSNVDIPPVYTEIAKGEKIVYQVKVFDLTSGGGLQNGLGPETVEIEYVVLDLDGGVLITRSEELVVDKQSQITNTISFPEGVETGTYILSAVVKYKTSVGISSQTFDIKEPSEKKGLGVNISDYPLLIVVGIALLIFLGVIFLFVYLLRERDKVFAELRRYNSREIREVKELLMAQQRAASRRRGADMKEIKKEVGDKISKLKRKQSRRVSEMRGMKSSGASVEYMKGKLKQWEAQGYNISPSEYKVKELSTSEMRKILKSWKKKYAKQVEKPKGIKRKKTSRKKR